VGRKKKDADRVNYNLTRGLRALVMREAARMGVNEVDAIEDLLRHGLVAKTLLKCGQMSYVDFSNASEVVIVEIQSASPQDSTSDAIADD
jgi:hypothetical protein